MQLSTMATPGMLSSIPTNVDDLFAKRGCPIVMPVAPEKINAPGVSSYFRHIILQILSRNFHLGLASFYNPM